MGESTGSMLCFEVPPLSHVRRTFLSPTLFFFFERPMTHAYPLCNPHALTADNKASKVANEPSGGGSIETSDPAATGNIPKFPVWGDADVDAEEVDEEPLAAPLYCCWPPSCCCPPSCCGPNCDCCCGALSSSSCGRAASGCCCDGSGCGGRC